MNRCSVSEDETTKALIALYQGPLLEEQSNLQNASGTVVAGATLSTFQHPDQHWLNHSLHAMPGGKKEFAKGRSNSANKDGSYQLLSSVKKGLHSSVKSRSLNDVNRYPAVSAVDIPGEKHKTKQKILDNNSDRGSLNKISLCILYQYYFLYIDI